MKKPDTSRSGATPLQAEVLAKPVYRGALRRRLGLAYYGTLRKLLWFKMRRSFARQRTVTPLPYLYFAHKTILLRKLKDVDMQLQYNKITNLKRAVREIDGIVLHPGEVLSYWRLIGAPTKRRGYVEGMILRNGRVETGTGGGLCQLANLIFWMTVHTPLTVIERHRHGFDVFPDANRTQPFGSGATCYYPHGDLMLRNDTEDDFQLRVHVGETHLEGEWRVSSPPRMRYEIVERNHTMKREYWGGCSRHNELYQQKYALDGTLLSERLIVKNSAIMMYSPFLEPPKKSETE